MGATSDMSTANTSQDAATGISVMIDALVADGPTPEFADKLELFGRLIGEWDIESSNFDDNGAIVGRGQGEWLFGWVLNGRAIQDLIIAPSRAVHQQTGAPYGEYGTAVRFYDAKIDAWQMTAVHPVFGVIAKLIAKSDEDGGIVMEGRIPGEAPHAGGLYRWTFSDIRADFFRWRGYWSEDDGQTWHFDEEILGRRRG
jgi:hypothetical protein